MPGAAMFKTGQLVCYKNWLEPVTQKYISGDSYSAFTEAYDSFTRNWYPRVHTTDPHLLMPIPHLYNCDQKVLLKSGSIVVLGMPHLSGGEVHYYLDRAIIDESCIMSVWCAR